MRIVTVPRGTHGRIRFQTMLHQTNDAELFRDAMQLSHRGFQLKRNHWSMGQEIFAPVYEAKMIQAYDHRAAGVVIENNNWMRQGQTVKTTPVNHQNPEFQPMPRYWVDGKLIDLPKWGCIGFKDISSATNQRTMIAGVCTMRCVYKPLRPSTFRDSGCSPTLLARQSQFTCVRFLRSSENRWSYAKLLHR